MSKARLDSLQSVLEDHGKWLDSGHAEVMDHLKEIRSHGERLSGRIDQVESKANETSGKDEGGPVITKNFWWLVGSTVLLVLLAILLLIFLIMACRQCWIKLGSLRWTVHGNESYQVNRDAARN